MSSFSFIRSVIQVAHVEFSSYDVTNHGLVYSSGLAAEILGYTEEEMYEFSHNYNDEIIHPDDLERMHQKWDDLMNSAPGQIIEAIARYRKKDGEYIWGYTRKLVSERGVNGEPLKITTVAQDITELINMQVELEKRVSQLEQISYVNAHELRGPVASILGLTNLMAEDGLIGEYNREIMHHLNRTVTKLDKVVNDLVKAAQSSD
jgi:PAS domain S-box-containing protein